MIPGDQFHSEPPAAQDFKAPILANRHEMNKSKTHKTTHAVNTLQQLLLRQTYRADETWRTANLFHEPCLH